jgi:hypothetical protein
MSAGGDDPSVAHPMRVGDGDPRLGLITALRVAHNARDDEAQARPRAI